MVYLLALVGVFLATPIIVQAHGGVFNYTIGDAHYAGSVRNIETFADVC